MSEFINDVLYYNENSMGGLDAVLKDKSGRLISIDDDKINGLSVVIYNSFKEFENNYDFDSDRLKSVKENYFK